MNEKSCRIEAPEKVGTGSVTYIMAGGLEP